MKIIIKENNKIYKYSDTNNTIEFVIQSWIALGVDYDLNDLYEDENVIYLKRIVIPEEKRNQNIGTNAMYNLITYANNVNKPILLTPSSSFGGKLNKLKEFYRNFRFVKNIDQRYKDSLIKFPD